MRILTHICCGPCLVYPADKLLAEGDQLVGFWYNPNIHPYTEYQQRLQALQRFQQLKPLEIEYNDSYDLEKYMALAMSDLESRCVQCYKLRLSEAAHYAKKAGLEYFTTTLLVSPYQKLDQIRRIGAELEIETGVKFLDLDIVSGYREGRRKAREMGLYLQKYCGCVFSEKDRFLPMRNSAGKKPISGDQGNEAV